MFYPHPADSAYKRASTLAYFAAASEAEKKGFITLTPGKKTYNNIKTILMKEVLLMIN